MHSIEVIRPPSDYPEEVIKWFMREYLSNHGIDLTVVYMDLSDEGVDGWCMREDDHEFIIQIDERLDGVEHTKTILHELYHVYQHLKKEPRCEICAHQMETILVDRFNKSL